MFAIIETGSKQYKVMPGDKIRIEKIEGSADGAVSFDRVLMVADGDAITVGAPLVKNARVEGKILSQDRARKIIVFKYHSKSRYQKKRGHRQPYTEVEIVKINA
jgi:large subunit ribosomal protein L21